MGSKKKKSNSPIKKIGNTRVVSVSNKIVFVFVILILMSSIATNYLSLLMGRGVETALLKRITVSNLLEVVNAINKQRTLYEVSPDIAIDRIKDAASNTHDNENSLTIAVASDDQSDGAILFQVSNDEINMPITFSDKDALERMKRRLGEGDAQGRIDFTFSDFSYLGVYHYNNFLDVFVLRAEEYQEIYSQSNRNFLIIMALITIITLGCAWMGKVIVKKILGFIPRMIDALSEMQEEQAIRPIPMDGAPNDDITFLGLSFNMLAHAVDNLIKIFRKFVTRDTAQQVYRERRINLTGIERNLTILFTDIRNFTAITEILGNDIIRIINMHYERAINGIHESDGDIGSIIGDALLAFFGVEKTKAQSKSLQAIIAGYRVLEATSQLRRDMYDRQERIIRQRGDLTDADKKILDVVLLKVGVGIAGGKVFYGNIGSQIRMANTVIGDPVNYAARLEGLTRIYNVPMLCSENVREEVLAINDDFHFLEIDQVITKGHSHGSKVYWPLNKNNIDEDMHSHIEIFKAGLDLHYKGKWKAANEKFSQCNLPMAKVFIERTKSKKAPRNWNGIWEMVSK